MILVYDQVISDKIGFPNLAQHQARPYTESWRQFDRHWPWVVPLRLCMYLDQCGIEYRCESASTGHGWYPIAFSWFDWDIDYFDLIPENTISRVIQGKIKILFYYHEGDNPHRIQQRLETMGVRHSISADQWVLISANTAAPWYFSEHECFFRYVNRRQSSDLANSPGEILKDFTLLNRQHKWWRASIVADLDRQGLLDNSIWSYDTGSPSIDRPEDNPISIYTIPDLPESIDKFIKEGPYRCDTLDKNQQNDHHWVNTDLYTKSYFHLVVETHFDADQSGGTFLTEKTWKCIKYGQPFVMIGPAGTLQHLREMGFRTFDHVIDNSYDQIIDPTERWIAIRKLIQWIKDHDVEKLWQRCQDDVRWNKNFFDNHTHGIVNNLVERLKCLK